MRCMKLKNKTSYKNTWLSSIMKGLILERTFLEELRAKNSIGNQDPVRVGYSQSK